MHTKTRILCQWSSLKCPKSLYLGLVLMLLTSTSAFAATATLYPDADAHVRNGGNAGNNYGTSTNLEVRASGAAWRMSFLKFDISGISGSVTSATLRVYANTSNGSSQTTGVHSVSDTSWTESGITWNNKPSFGTQLDTVDISGTSYSWHELDVTSYIASEVAGSSSLVSFCLENTNDAVAVTKLQSSENSSSPELVIVTGSTDTEAPSVPTGLAAGTATTTAIDLSWNASTDNVGVAGYNIHTNGSNPVSVTGTSTTITGLTQNTTYTFTVSAYDAASNESSVSSGVNATTADGQPPSVPTGLASSNITTTTVDLSWNASSDNVGVTGYKVYTNGLNPVSVSGTSTTITGLTENTNYDFTVSACDAAENESAQSSAVNVTTASSSGPLISEDFSSGASNFTAVAGGTWSVSSGRYVLSSPATSGTNGVLGNISVHDTSITGDFVLTTVMRITGTGSSWNDAAIVFGYQDTSNYYYVSLNESNDGNTKGVFKVVSGTPTELADITVSVASDTDYPIEITRSGSSIVVEVNSSQVASTSDSTFTGGKVGFGSFNDGSQFDDLVVLAEADITAPSVPTGLASSNITDTTVDLDWNASSDNVAVAGYQVYTGGSNPVDVGNTTGVTVSGLTPDTSYTFTVSAYDAANNESSQSSGVNVTTDEEVPQVATPQFSPGGGTYSSTQNVTITTATSGATIRYTTDGSTPSQSNGTVYSSAIAISSTTMLKAIAYKSGMTDSNITSATYSISTGTITHGSQATRYNVGARLGMYASGLDTRTQETPSTISGFTHSSGTATYTNKIITSQVRVTGGTLTLNNCWIKMPTNTSSANYALVIAGGVCEFQDLTITQPNYDSMNILINNGGLKGESILLLGGEDTIHINNEVGSGGLAYPSYQDPDYPDFTGARVILTDGYFGDRYREGAKHADNFQVDGGGRVILKRINMQAHRIVWPAIPPDTQWDGNPSNIGSAAVILTQNSSNPRQIDKVAVYDCNFDGGNYTVHTNPNDGLPVTGCFLRGNTWGSTDPVTGGYVAIYNHGPMSTDSGTTKTDNTWLNTGTALKLDNSTTTSVTAGSPL